MELDNELKIAAPKDVDDCEEGNDGSLWQSLANDRWARPLEQHTQPKPLEQYCQPKPRPDGRLDVEEMMNALGKHGLMSTTTREIAKAVALDGTLTDPEKADLKTAFQEAYSLGCEKEFVQSPA